MKWLELNSPDQFKDLADQETVFAIFKHSTRCAISSTAKHRVERDWTFDFPIYQVDVLRSRALSDQIAKQSGIRHESPQLIVFRNGRPVYQASHSFISVKEIELETK